MKNTSQQLLFKSFRVQPYEKEEHCNQIYQGVGKFLIFQGEITIYKFLDRNGAERSW